MRNVENIYALSPMQEVMLLHATSQRSDDVLFNQFCYKVRGTLNINAFESAWQQLVERHEIFRTAFAWEKIKKPIQVVRRQVELPCNVEDWSHESEEQQQSLLNEFRKEDRRRGFDPRKAPLMRISLMCCDVDSHYFVWSSHHLLLDRWCLKTVFEEFSKIYTGFDKGQNVAAHDVSQYRDYIRWIREQDECQAKLHWQTTMAGLLSSVSITNVSRGAAERRSVRLSQQVSKALRGLARSAGVTASVVMQGAWSLLLNRMTGSQDIVFGTVVAGRPASLRDVESIVGSFVNNVPVRIRIPGDVTLGAWLKSSQQSQHERSAFEYVSPAAIQRWSGLPVGQPMFDTLIVTLGAVTGEGSSDLKFVPIPGEVTTAYPLTLSIDDAETEITVHASLQRGRQCVVSLVELLSSYEDVIAEIAIMAPTATLGRMPGFRGQSTSAELIVENPDSGGPVEECNDVTNQMGREDADVDMMQDLLLTEWQSALRIDDISPDDDFFELGGSSLQAASLHARIESATRKSLPMLALFRSTNLRGMAKTMAAGDWPLRSDLIIPLRSGGSRAPLFCVASPEVNTVGYALMTRYLNEEQPVFVLQAPPDTDSMRRLSPLELPDLAAVYLQKMRTHQSHGPYYLLGMCTGSQLVLEMARQLDAVGERVAFAGVINTWALYTVSRWYRLQRVFNNGRWYLNRVRQIWQQEPAKRLSTLRAIVGRRYKSLLSVFGFGADGGAQRLTAENARRESTGLRSADDEDGLLTPAGDPWIEDFGWARNDPFAKKYSGTLTVFRIKPQEYWRVGDDDLGWGRHAAKTEIERLSGKDHEAILREPQVRQIAQRIAAHLTLPEQRLPNE